MKVSLSWLTQYVDVDMPSGDLGHMLTMAGLEVEAVEDRYAHLSTVVAGRIVDSTPHPEADKLSVCRVDAGGREYAVVCGAPNAAPGLVAPLALPGTELPDGTEVGEARIRGVLSSGMLCSEAELALGPDAGRLLELDADTPVGKNLADALGLSDTVFEIGLTPNRPDCLSVVGVAREVAAITGKPLRTPEMTLPEGVGDAASETSVTIEAPEHCPRYVARLVKGVKIGPSPKWLADRLLSVGMRPINNIVDITNFVMMELNQPLHAFDFNRLEEHRIVVRTADEGERFTTLDSQERVLTADTLMICDGGRPVAVAGVMGGENSEIVDTTEDVLIESAWFNPASIRRTARRMGLSTDASHRFERGTDPEGCVRAADRAAQLMVEVAGGSLVRGVVDAYPRPWEPPVVELSVDRCNMLLGNRFSRREIEGYLEAVGIRIEPGGGDTVTARPPSHRVDIFRPEDLVEEVARLWGYDNIPVTSPVMAMDAAEPDPRRLMRDRLRTVMVGLGFYEAVNYSFTHGTSPDRLNVPEGDRVRARLPLRNPLSEDQSVMRTSMIPGMLISMARNLNQNVRDLRLFEVGKVFFADTGESLPEEVEKLALLVCGTRYGTTWAHKEAPVDFYDIKGVCEGLFSALRIGYVRWRRPEGGEAAWLRPGYGAVIEAGGYVLGSAGQVDPEVLKAYEVKTPAFVAELDVAGLLTLLPDTVTYEPLPRFPATSRDVTLILDKAVDAQSVLDTVTGRNEDLVESVAVIDVYEGKPIPEGRKSLTVRVTYRSPERTLTDDEVNPLQQAITDGLIEAHKAELPG
ncbi:MAG: phenylalanine--tRNA ligase subunit beta [Desulfatibacillaceae bacterium]